MLKTIALYGKNASGKSNLIAALRVMRDFVADSASRLNAGDAIQGVVPFRLDNKRMSEPSAFTATLYLNGKYFEYSFSATALRVVSESLKELPNSVWFDRRVNKEGKYETKFDGPLRLDGGIVGEKTRENALILSVGAQLNNEALTSVYRWFRERFWVLDMSEAPMHLLYSMSENIRKDEDLRDKAASLMADADFGIEDLKIVEPVEPEPDPDLPPGARRVTLPDGTVRVIRTIPRREINVRTLHRGASNELIEFAFPQEESNGTQRVFAMAGPLLRAIARGQLIVIDEFDCSMHPLLARSLIQFFQFETAVTGSQSQMIIATHDATLFDKDVFRRDELWITDKHSSGRSILYSLHDFSVPPRSSAAFQKNYMAGRFGGIPHFGELLERYSRGTTTESEESTGSKD